MDACETLNFLNHNKLNFTLLWNLLLSFFNSEVQTSLKPIRKTLK